MIPNPGRTNSIYAYFGGKSRLVKDIVSMIPEHKTFVEVCAGSAVLTLNKPKSKLEVVNDLDPLVFNFYSVLKDKKLYKDLHKLMRFTPYGYKQFNMINEQLKEKQYSDDPLEKAHLFLASITQSFMGKLDSSWTGKSGTKKRAAKYKKMVESIPEYHKRFRNVEVRNKNFLSIVKEFDAPDTVFYIDPPYAHSERTSKNEYRFELPTSKHRRLIRILCNRLTEPKMKGKWILAGYSSLEYRSSLKHVYRTELEVKVNAGTVEKGGEKPTATECMWFNFPLDEYAIKYLTNSKRTRIHDYFGTLNKKIVFHEKQVTQELPTNEPQEKPLSKITPKTKGKKKS